MLDNVVVLRALVDQALDGKSSWQNAAELADYAQVGAKNTYKALQHPTAIGAIRRHPRGGFDVTDTERLLMLFAARRTLKEAKITSFHKALSVLKDAPVYAIGGSRAAAFHLTGSEPPTQHAMAILYVPEGYNLKSLPTSTNTGVSGSHNALIITSKPRDFEAWRNGYTSKAQTFSDLFAQPGPQARAFQQALWNEWFNSATPIEPSTDH